MFRRMLVVAILALMAGASEAQESQAPLSAVPLREIYCVNSGPGSDHGLWLRFEEDELARVEIVSDVPGAYDISVYDTDGSEIGRNTNPFDVEGVLWHAGGNGWYQVVIKNIGRAVAPYCIQSSGVLPDRGSDPDQR